MMSHTAIITTTVIERRIDVTCSFQKYRTDAGSGNINTWDYPTGLIPGEAAGLPGGSQKKMLGTVRSWKIAVETASGHEAAFAHRICRDINDPRVGPGQTHWPAPLP